jgi:hypothetical protein
VDLKLYFHKIKTIEATIANEHVVIISKESPDGAREGQPAEVTRGVAAKLIAVGKARLATEEESSNFNAAAAAAKSAAEEQQKKSKLQLNVVPEADMALLRSALAKK